ncbi:MAG: hypothetical protein ACOCU9_01910 [Spirochaetota bacterium]
MSDRDRRTRADWAEYENAGRDLEARAAALGLPREALEEQIEQLQLAVEGGVVEYKRNLVNRVFRELEEARYRSLTGEEIRMLARGFAVFVYVSTIQRFLADGTLQIRDQRTPEASRAEPEAQADVKAIIAEIQQRVKSEPELRTKQPVKNILMQLSRYSRELEQFKEITARTPADKRAGMAANFRRVTEEIFASIRKNYEQLEQDDRAAVPSEPRHLLLRLPIDQLAGLCLKQTRSAMEVRSGLLYARDEQYGTRELLLELADRHEALMKLVGDEERRYREIAGTERLALQVSRAFSQEIQKRIARETEVY